MRIYRLSFRYILEGSLLAMALLLFAPGVWACGDAAKNSEPQAPLAPIFLSLCSSNASTPPLTRVELIVLSARALMGEQLSARRVLFDVTGESVASSVSGAFWSFVFAATDDAEGQEIYGIGNQVFQTPRSQKSILSQWNRIRLEWWRELGLANASFRSRPPAISAPDPFDTHAQRPANKS